MNAFGRIFSLLVLLLGTVPALAQFQDAVDWKTYHKPTGELEVGDVVTIYFDGTIKAGFHVYSAVAPKEWPQLASYLELDEDDNKGVSLKGPLKEEGHAETNYDDIFETDITIYHDHILFKQQVTITEENPSVAAYLTYQVCDISQCVPGTIDYEVQLKAKKAVVKPTPEPTTTKPPKQEPKPDNSQSANTAKTPQIKPVTETVSPVLVTEAPKIEAEVATETPEAVDDSQSMILTPDNTQTEASTGDPSSPSTKADTSEEEPKSMLSIIIEGLLFGFGSLLTPCIFPLIPLTVSFFTKQSKTRSEGIQNAIIYGLSIIFIFTFLGLLVSIIFGGDTLRQVAVNPWFNLAIFGLIFVFALSFLGMFDITLPSSWSTALSAKSEKGGIMGIFFMALVLVIVSFSCVGPLVATNLFEAARGDSYFGPTIGMLSFSSALAIPFMIFAAFPGLMNNLPKSGGWLNSVKVVLGFIELALCLVYFSRADLVWQMGWLDREIFLGAWIVISFLLGIYLLGKLKLPHDSPMDRVSVPRLLMAISCFWFALYLVPGLWGASLPMLGGYLPPSGQDIGVKVIGGHSAPATSSNELNACNYPDKISGYLSKYSHDGFCAFYDLEQGLAYAKKVNKPVFLDFTGITCANCRLLESTAWVDPEIQRLITQEYVLVSLYTDDRTKLAEPYRRASGEKVRTYGDKWVGYETDQYGSNAQPYYVLLDHDKNELMPPTGYNPPLDMEFYQTFFKQGLAKFRNK